MISNIERTLPSPFGSTVYGQNEMAVAMIKFAPFPMEYHLRRTAQSRTQGRVLVRWLGLIPTVFSYNFISRIKVAETKLFEVVGKVVGLLDLSLYLITLTPLKLSLNI